MLDGVQAQQMRLLRSLCPPIKAFGIGGSIAAQHADKFADLDFFILLPSRSFFKHLRAIRMKLPGVPTIACLLEPEFHPGFGFQLSYILRNGTSIEYFFNCLELLTDDPMALKTRVLFDPAGVMTKHRGRTLAKRRVRARKLLRRVAHDYLIEVLRMRKFAVRGEVLPFSLRLVHVRRVLLTLDRYAMLRAICSPHDAERHLLHDFGKEYVAGILRTFPQTNERSIFHSLRVMRSRILRHLRRFARAGLSVSNVAYFEVERAVFHELEMALKIRA
jgi:hypothetical protein